MKVWLGANGVSRSLGKHSSTAEVDTVREPSCGERGVRCPGRREGVSAAGEGNEGCGARRVCRTSSVAISELRRCPDQSR